jgi:hypothetical protein
LVIEQARDGLRTATLTSRNARVVRCGIDELIDRGWVCADNLAEDLGSYLKAAGKIPICARIDYEPVSKFSVASFTEARFWSLIDILGLPRALNAETMHDAKLRIMAQSTPEEIGAFRTFFIAMRDRLAETLVPGLSGSGNPRARARELAGWALVCGRAVYDRARSDPHGYLSAARNPLPHALSDWLPHAGDYTLVSAETYRGAAEEMALQAESALALSADGSGSERLRRIAQELLARADHLRCGRYLRATEGLAQFSAEIVAAEYEGALDKTEICPDVITVLRDARDYLIPYLCRTNRLSVRTQVRETAAAELTL